MKHYGNGYVTIPFDSSKFDVGGFSPKLNGKNLMPASKLADLLSNVRNKPIKLLDEKTGIFFDLIVNYVDKTRFGLVFIANQDVSKIIKKELYLEYMWDESQYPDDPNHFEWYYTDGASVPTETANAYYVDFNGIA